MQKLSPLKPPFRGLTPLLWIYFLLCFVLHSQSSIMQGRFVDPDDIMYALQSAELLDGQGWYDRTEHRMNPPADGTVGGTPFHFTRLMELPYAATLAVLSPLIDRADAILVMSAIWPPLFLLALLLLYRRQARLFLPKPWTGIAAFICMTAQGLLFDFMPGHIDHHGFVALLINLCLGLLLLMVASPHKTKFAAAAGVVMAIALAIGLEALPWLIAFTGFLGVWASLCPRRARAALAYGGAMLGSALLLLPAYRLDILTPDITAFSIVYIALLFGIFLCLGVIWLLRNEADTTSRLAKGAIFAAMAGAVFLGLFPDLLQGPYNAVDARLMKFMLPNTKEAIPLVMRVNPSLIAISFLPFPLVALAVCIWRIRATRYRTRQAWLLITIMHALGLALALFYESRYVPYSQMFGVIPLSWLLFTMARKAPPWRAFAYAAVPVLAAALPLVTVYGMSAENAFLYPMMSYAPPCDLATAARALNASPFDLGPPRLILNAANQGPDILLATRHNILSASFHENVDGNLDSMDFFRAPDSDTAASIVRKRKADLVLLCDNVDRGYVVEDDDMNMALPHPFVLSLVRGQLPDWLQPVRQDASSHILLFRVVPEKLPK